MRYSPREGRKRSVSPKGKEKVDGRASSSLLDKEFFTVNGVSVKYAEPKEASLPTRKWKLFVFKEGKHIKVIELDGQTCYRIGRDPKISDILTEHESCSKQHAVIQHREIIKDVGYGKYESTIRPYIIDIDSVHGTHLNGKLIEKRRYIELLPKDVLRFAYSTREYVVMVDDVE